MTDVAYRPNQWVQAGLLIRGNLRLALRKAGIEYRETKSFGTSVFELKVSPAHYRQIRVSLRKDGLLND